jgi:hypothetical protein
LFGIADYSDETANGKPDEEQQDHHDDEFNESQASPPFH